MKVTRLPKDPGPAGWARLLPDLAPARSLESDIRADWLVIGAGFAGLAAARRLSQTDPGSRITILEASRVGEGPAGRNSGFMIDLPHDLASSTYAGALEKDRQQTEANRFAIAFAGEMARDFDLPSEAFARTGKINAAATEKGQQHNLDYATHLGALGERCETFDAAHMRSLTGSTFYQSGLFTAGAAIIQPAMFVRGVADGLRSNRINIFEASPVLSLDRAQDWIAKTPRGSVTAPNVILAVNGHLNSFGYYKSRFLHVFTYASMTRVLTAEEIRALGGAATWGVTPADPMGTTVRRISGTGGDRIVIRNRFTCDPSMEVDDGRIRRVSRDHDASFRARFPMLTGVGMEFRWGGRLCLSKNDVSVTRQIEPGLFAACCQNGLGTTKGTLAGILAADLATGTTNPHLGTARGAEEPTRLPPATLTALGANAYLKWAEYRAGAEL